MQRIIHQVWVGPYRMPTRESGFVRRMRELHPTHEHRLWTSPNLPAMPPFLQERFDWRISQRDYAFAADIVRVYVVWLFGGVYFDVDTEPIRSVEPLCAGVDALFRHHAEGDTTFSNDFIGLRKGHPLGWYLLESMKAPAYDFGPHWLGATVKRYCTLPMNATHQAVKAALAHRNMRYVPSARDHTPDPHEPIWYDHFRNHALFSWSDENRARFARGEMP